MYDVIVIGAGAAGIIAAGRASRNGASVLLIEKMDRPGKKLLITGNGRCNITYEAPQSEYFKNIFPNPRYLKHAFSSFFKDDIIRLLNEKGLKTFTDDKNKVFPTSNQSADVVNALWDWMMEGNPKILFNTLVNDLLIEDNTVKGAQVIGTSGKQKYYAHKVIITTGGKSYPSTGSTGDGFKWASGFGHKVINPLPALVPLRVKELDVVKKIQGISIENCRVNLWVNGKKESQLSGDLMFSHFGLTGPVILNFSRKVLSFIAIDNKVVVSLDLKPEWDERELDEKLNQAMNENGKKQVENILRPWLPSRMIPVLLEQSGIDGQKTGGQLKALERRSIRMLMKDMRFTITGSTGFKNAIITSGGVDLNDVHSGTMESKKIKGLFFAGEVLNLNGNTGGFNLQIAFSTGWLAGENVSTI